MAYRPPTDGFHPCLRCGADVADGAQFCPVCGAPQNVAPVLSRRKGTPWWVPAGIIAGAIAALGAGVLLAALLDDGPDPVGRRPEPHRDLLNGRIRVDRTFRLSGADGEC